MRYPTLRGGKGVVVPTTCGCTFVVEIISLFSYSSRVGFNLRYLFDHDLMKWRVTSSQTCAPAFDRCGKVYTNVGEVETFDKKCLVKEKCVTEATCQNSFGTMECEVHCSDTDDCNAGPTFRISGSLLMACALASLIILVKS